MPAPPEYCSIKTIAEQLDCSVSTVESYTNRGLLPQPKKRGTLVRWKWSEVQEMMDGLAEAEQELQDPILRAIHAR
ncbi:AlpA family transcriptional regulator [Sulfitobacter sp. 20_GPM-1509m]|uniref:helix-turn-helix transcriptional regulator n=1 Tax=Sulfitobacter sp. 20_GPM-1509m TaxID=1380367 RepID=UPI0005654E15|nr:MerR family transcriptional regulator [Sulfitobacter sp. 20_GPM-1509m]